MGGGFTEGNEGNEESRKELIKNNFVSIVSSQDTL